MAIATESVAEVCRAAKRAARTLATLDTRVKDAALEAIAAGARGEHRRRSSRRTAPTSTPAARPACRRRCSTGSRSTSAASRRWPRACAQIAALPDPVGEVLDGVPPANGLEIRKVRVPLGVVAVVYEARPNVTIDAAALCLKSGNAVVLRGSSSAARSNAVLAAIAARAAESAGVPEGAISISPAATATSSPSSRRRRAHVDLIIPRGGEGLKAALVEHATVPVIYAASGNCHVYVDAARRPRAGARDRAQREGAAAGRLQRRRDAARAPRRRRGVPARELCARSRGAGVELRGDERARELAPAASRSRRERRRLGHRVPRADARRRASSTRSRRRSRTSRRTARGTPRRSSRATQAAARRFQLEVDAACVYVNASTRFTDGGEFGMGAEIGNSTQKLHARGPIGLRELCTCKYLVEGDGHVRS